MNMTGIIIAAAVVGIVGIVIGVLLGIASEKFKVEVDEKEILVRAELPGNNCGGCGYAGCDALAKAIAEGKAKVDQCPVGGAPVGEKIAAIMGVEAGSAEKKVACGKCAEACPRHLIELVPYDKQTRVACSSHAKGKAVTVACELGCIGCKKCEKNCPSEAITVTDFCAHIDYDKCTGCGKCKEVCPRHVIL